MKKKISLRILAAILALAMLVATGVTTVTALEIPHVTEEQFNAAGRDVITTTDAQIVAKYDYVGAKEKVILECNAIVSDSHVIPKPNNDDNLITVDVDNQTVSAEPFVSGDYVWKPVRARVVWEDAAGTKQEQAFALDASGVGRYNTDIESYTIKVDYEVRVALDEGYQKMLINTPAYLTSLIANLNLVAACESDLALINEDAIFDALVSMTGPLENGLTIFNDSHYAHHAILDLKRVRNANGGKFELLDEIALYNAYKKGEGEYAGMTATAYLVERGDDFKAAYDAIVDNLVAVAYAFNDRMDLMETLHDLDFIDDKTFNNLTTLNDALGRLAVGISDYVWVDKEAGTTKPGKVPADNWDGLGFDLVKENATLIDLMNLDANLATLMNSDKTASNAKLHQDENTIEAEPVAATVELETGVSQIRVNVSVKANVIGLTSEDNNTLSELNGKSASFLTNEEASDTAILNKIDSMGICNEAIDHWATNAADYGINTNNYEKQVTVTRGEDQITVAVTYTPKTFTVKKIYGNMTEEKTVYYGYRLKLENAAPGKSYDYTVNGVSKYQGEIIKVTENVTVTRTLGGALNSSSIPAIIAGSSVGNDLTKEAMGILKTNAFKVNENPELFGTLKYRVPAEVTLESVDGVDNKYTVTAPIVASGLPSGAKWYAVSVELQENGEELKTFVDKTVNEEAQTVVFDIDFEGDFENIKVNYALDVTDISKEDAKIVAKIPHQLAVDAKEQLEVLDKMAEGSLYNILGELNGSKINLIVSIVNGSNMSQAAKDAVQRLKNYGVDTRGEIYLRGYLTSYKSAKAKGASDGLRYYYTGNNAANIKNQLDILSDVFNLICPPNTNNRDRIILVDLLEENGYGNYVEKLDSVRDALAECKDVPAVNEYVDTNSASLGSLASAVYNAIDKTNAYTGDGEVIYTSSVIRMSNNNKSMINIVVNIMKGDGTVVTYSDSVIISNDAAIGEELLYCYKNLASQLPINMGQYDVVGEGEIPFGDMTAGELVEELGDTIVVTYTPHKYTVNVPGLPPQHFYADTDWTVTLPAPDNNSQKFVYNIEGKLVDVVEVAAKYTFDSLDIFGSDRTYNVGVEEVNLDNEKLFNFIDLMNTALESIGARLIPMQDANGNIAIVLRMSANANTDDMAAALENLMYALTTYDYIELGSTTFWDGESVHLQSIIDMVANSKFSLDVLCNIITPNGAVINDAALSKLSPMMAANGNIGGKLMTSSIRLDGRTMGFYVTLSDNTPASALSNIRKVASTVKGYVNLVCDNGRFQVVITAPDSVYPYYLMHMLVAGNADLIDISGLDLRGSVEYEMNILSQLLEHDGLSVESIENTFKNYGVNVDLSAFKGALNTVINIYKYLGNNIDIEVLETRNDSYGAAIKVDVHKVFQILGDQIGLNETMLNFVYESGADSEPLEVKYEVKLSNIIDKQYEAIVFDVNGSGITKKFYCTTDLTATLNSLGNHAIVILTSDVVLDRNVYIPGNAVLNLNGYIIKGNISTGGTVRVVDSRIATDAAGGIDGNLSGSFLLTAGRYTDNVSAYVKTGYYVNENGYVCNDIYTIKQTGDNLQIALSASYLYNTHLVDFQSLLLDVAIDIALNLYNGSAISINGNYIYNFGFEDITAILAGGKNEVLNSVMDIFDVKGFSNIFNSIIAALCDFDGLEYAILNDESVADFEICVENWRLAPYITEGNYISFTTVPENSKTGSFTVVIEGTDAEKENLAAFCRDLSVINVNNFEVNFNDFSYNNGFVVDFDGDIDIHIDLSENRAYAALICAAVAYSTTDVNKKSEYVDAVDKYVNGKGSMAIANAIENMTTAELIKACRALEGVSCEKMLTAIGLDVNEKTQGMIRLYNSYDQFVNAFAKVLNRLDVEGNSSNLAGNKVDGTFATYEFEREFVGRFSVKLTITTVPMSEEMIFGALAMDYNNEMVKGFQNLVFSNGMEGALIDTLNKGMSVEVFLSLISIDISGALTIEIKVYDKNGNEVTNGLIATGGKFVIVAGNEFETVTQEYAIVILGDTNDNGRIEAGDAAKIAAYYKGKVEMTEAELFAADMNHNGRIEAGDAAKIAYKYKHLDEYKSSYSPEN